MFSMRSNNPRIVKNTCSFLESTDDTTAEDEERLWFEQASDTSLAIFTISSEADTVPYPAVDYEQSTKLSERIDLHPEDAKSVSG